ncbi:MAG: hypothetical protein IJ682_04645 [Lachnospiraceae bacterium]|nr:hypothetical protein [Lachnospiraceae bacterium]
MERTKEFKRTARGMAAAALAAAIFAGSITENASATERTTYTLDGSGTEKSGSVTAKFTIGDAELSALGYTTTVSIPNAVTLTLSDGKFTGSDYIGVSGILESAQTVKVKIDTDSADYKTVRGPAGFSKNLSPLPSDRFAESLSKTSWSAPQAYANLEDKTAGKAVSAWTEQGKLSVSIDGKAFVPRYKGSYTTAVPLIIELDTP